MESFLEPFCSFSSASVPASESSESAFFFPFLALEPAIIEHIMNNLDISETKQEISTI